MKQQLSNTNKPPKVVVDGIPYLVEKGLVGDDFIFNRVSVILSCRDENGDKWALPLLRYYSTENKLVAVCHCCGEEFDPGEKFQKLIRPFL